ALRRHGRPGIECDESTCREEHAGGPEEDRAHSWPLVAEAAVEQIEERQRERARAVDDERDVGAIGGASEEDRDARRREGEREEREQGPGRDGAAIARPQRARQVPEHERGAGDEDGEAEREVDEEHRLIWPWERVRRGRAQVEV